MKKKILLIGLLLCSFAGISQKKKEITPKKSVAKVVISGKHDYTYYALSEKVKTVYTVSGPGKLYLNFRVRIEGDIFKSSPFRVKYIRSENYVETVEIPELLSSNLKFKSATLEGSPSRLQKLEIDVPPGVHTYTYYKYKTDQKVHMRAFYESHPKPVWTDLKPTMYLEKKEIKFIKSGNIRSYYRITKQSGFDFSITDTTRLRVIIRPEFSYNMLDETILKIKVENLTTGHATIYKVNSNKSDKLEFVSDDKLTPGTSSTFYLNLTKPLASMDSYSVNVLSGAKAAVIRLSKDNNLLK